MSEQQIDNEIKKLFLEEIKVQLPKLKQCLANPKDTLQLETLMEILQAIEQAASIVQFTILMDVSARLIKHISEDSIKNGIIEEALQQLRTYTNLLNSLVKTSPDELENVFKQQYPEFERIKNWIVNSLRKDSSEATIVSFSPLTKFEALVNDPSMFELFRIELETQAKELSMDLLDWEREKNPVVLESMMRAAHSIKGAARIVGLNSIVKLAHIMEDCFVYTQMGKSSLGNEEIDCLLKGVDFLLRLTKVNYERMPSWLADQEPKILQIVGLLQNPSLQLTEETESAKNIENRSESIKGVTKQPGEKNAKFDQFSIGTKQFVRDRVLRVTADSLNRLMGLAGESVVESHWLDPFGESLQHIKKEQLSLSEKLDLIREKMILDKVNPQLQEEINHLQNDLFDIRMHFSQRLEELEYFIRRHTSLSDRLYQEVINSRMRPFADGVEAFPRMIRDLAKQLGKSVSFEVEGKSTPVDRDILEKIEAPLSHLLRNAVDHGIETPAERIRQGKPPEGVIGLEASHRGAVLSITVSDDGRGIDYQRLRHILIDKSLISSEIASHLEDSEIAEFLFLPGFSTAKEVTEISGRGVGLNVVKDVIQEVGGIVKIISKPGSGTSFLLQLPLTLSVIRALIVMIAGEPYAFPLSRVTHTCVIHKEEIEIFDLQQFFYFDNKPIGLISAAHILELNEPQEEHEKLCAVIIGDQQNEYALIVDRLIGERELVVHQLNRKLGHIVDILAAALLEDGSPVLILDIEEMIRSIEKILLTPLPKKIEIIKSKVAESFQKTILVVDDSLTVREVESRLLRSKGFEVDSVGNGLDAWKSVRAKHYDLLITDLEMPKMDGHELIKLIRSDRVLRYLPIIIISYKESEQERYSAMEEGASYFFSKNNFQDKALLDAVTELIGEPVYTNTYK